VKGAIAKPKSKAKEQYAGTRIYAARQSSNQFSILLVLARVLM